MKTTKTVRDARRDLDGRAMEAARVAASTKRAELGMPDWYQVHRATSPWTCPGCKEPVQAWGDEVMCPCIQAARTAARGAYWRANIEDAAREAWPLVDVPARFRSASFDTFQRRPGTEAAITACRKYADTFARPGTEGGLFLVGKYGTGKTHLAVATARRVFERTFTAPVVVTAADLVTQHTEDGFNDAPIQNAARAELLVLDDLGQVRATDFRREVLYRVLDERYQHARPTIITSNAGTGQLTEIYGGALVSRLWEMAQPVELTASDYRAERAKAA